MNMASDYSPSTEGQKILEAARGYVDSVDYQVTARWLFYRLLQDSFYTRKEDYKGKFIPLLSRARKAFYEGWKPDSLADTARSATIRGGGHTSVRDWFAAVTSAGVACPLDIWADQPNYIEIWFEAEAMSGQFQHYTEHVTLRPFKGDPSLDFKWRIAMALQRRAERFPDKPIKVLYFGDLDQKGLSIPTSALQDIRKWSDVDFDFERCGLNPDHPERFNIAENPEKPGTYQWEALSDAGAKELITSAVSKHFDQAAAERILAKRQRAETWLVESMAGLTLPAEVEA